MLEATFSPLIPADNGEEFYKNFYYQYSFIQINDVFIACAGELLSEEEQCNLVSNLNLFSEDQDCAAVWALGAGMMNPAIMRRRKENRGISTELFNSLKAQNVNPLDWYKKAMEFLMIYALCEQAVKEYIRSSRSREGLDGEIEIEESKIIFRLFDRLYKDGLGKNFISLLSAGSSGALGSQNELTAAWMYYTRIRHTLSHAGGRTTNKARESMEDSIAKNKKELEEISSAMIFELDDSGDGIFFVNPLAGDIVDLSDRHMNFFRNMAVLIVESIERVLHPDEYEIEEFDPYKL